ncbi:EF-hand domain-containing protein [Pacificimonas flava]|uniref:EF-hand domain-containing protein n=1 Tax=Pacificimonas flava TaxID=1234595 RepID=UPI0004B015D8|nr:EF-hand domain-containing protein [Pacificimonas flava]MBB5279699.1 hypothetical protein [Pacificimonas flava]
MSAVRKSALAGLIVILSAIAVIGWMRTPTCRPASAPPPCPETAGIALETAASTQTAPPPLKAPSAPPPDPAERERKRFERNDDNDDRLVSREEYLDPRRKSFARMDTNGDGIIDFEEYSVEQRERFAASDCNASGTLTPDEFKSTATRKDAPEPDC